MTAVASPTHLQAHRFLAAVERTNLVLVLIALVVTHLAAGFGLVWNGVAAGGVLGAVNWRAVAWLAGRFLAAPKRARGFYAAVAGVKMVVLMGAVWAVLALLPVDPLGFLIGVSTLMASIFGTSFWISLSPAPRGGALTDEEHGR